MKFAFLFYFFIMIHFFVNSQDEYTGLYVNSESNEFICFYHDTIHIRIYNNDAFGTYSIGKGKYVIDNTGLLLLQKNIIGEETSVIERDTGKDNNIVITILGSNDTPMKFVPIKIYKNSGNNYFVEITSDNNGEISLDEEQVNYLNGEKACVYIETIGFITEKEYLFEAGYNYVIKSKIPEEFPFSFVQETDTLLIKKINSQVIEIEIGKASKLELSKIDINNLCFEYLFDKDIIDFLKKHNYNPN